MSINLNVSPREKEVLNLIACEYTTKEIASKLYISVHTADSHRRNLMEKLDVKNTAGLVRRGFEKGILRAFLTICIIVSLMLHIELASTLSAQELMIVESGITISNATSEAPASGTIRWNPVTKDFEGYDGSVWKSLTISSGGSGLWGRSKNEYYENRKIFPPNNLVKSGVDFGRSIAVEGNHMVITSSQNAFLYQDEILIDTINFPAEYASISGDWILMESETEVALYNIISETITTFTQDLPKDFGGSISIFGDHFVFEEEGSECIITYQYMQGSNAWTRTSPICPPASVTFGKPWLYDDILFIGFQNGGDPSVSIYRLVSGSWTLDQTISLAGDFELVSNITASSEWLFINASITIGDNFHKDLLAYQWNGSDYVFHQSLGYFNTPIGIWRPISLDTDVLVVANDITCSVNCAVTFNWDGTLWIRRSTLLPSTFQNTGTPYFGEAVLVKNDKIYISQYHEYHQGYSEVGAVYIYDSR